MDAEDEKIINYLIERIPPLILKQIYDEMRTDIFWSGKHPLQFGRNIRNHLKKTDIEPRLIDSEWVTYVEKSAKKVFGSHKTAPYILLIEIE